MDSHEWNKIFGAVLGTVLFVLAVNIVSEAIYAPPEEAEAAVEGQGATAGAETPAAPAAPAAPAESLPNFAEVIPAADVMAGAMSAEICGACHDWTKGGPNKIGPNLYGVVGRPKASHPGYEYSAAMKEKGGNWTYEDLFRFLARPMVFMPGTKMAFAGVPREQERINLIAFLRMQADEPAPLP